MYHIKNVVTNNEEMFIFMKFPLVGDVIRSSMKIKSKMLNYKTKDKIYSKIEWKKERNENQTLNLLPNLAWKWYYQAEK